MNTECKSILGFTKL